MNILIPVVCVIAVVFIMAIVLLIYVLTAALLKSIDHVNKVNSQLLLLIAGKDEKPETLRALVAQDRQPSKPLAGVAAGIVKGKKEEKSKNQDYVISVGGK